MSRAKAAEEEVADAAAPELEPVAEPEAAEELLPVCWAAPPEPPLEEAVAVIIEDMALLLVEMPVEAFFEPQTTDKQSVWPGRSFGCAATQSPLHLAQTREGRVWS